MTEFGEGSHTGLLEFGDLAIQDLDLAHQARTLTNNALSNRFAATLLWAASSKAVNCPCLGLPVPRACGRERLEQAQDDTPPRLFADGQEFWEDEIECALQGMQGGRASELRLATFQ
jgi:hypothetical protein